MNPERDPLGAAQQHLEPLEPLSGSTLGRGGAMAPHTGHTLILETGPEPWPSRALFHSPQQSKICRWIKGNRRHGNSTRMHFHTCTSAARTARGQKLLLVTI